jgi:hypothetical protein
MPALPIAPHLGLRTMATKRKANVAVEQDPALLPKRRGRPRKDSLIVHKRSSSTDANPRRDAKQESTAAAAKTKVTQAINETKGQATGQVQKAKETVKDVKNDAQEVAKDVRKDAKKASDNAEEKATSFANAAVDAIEKGPQQVKKVLESVQGEAKSSNGGKSKQEDYTSGDIPQSQKTGLLVTFSAVAAWFAFGGKLQRKSKDTR